MKMLANCIRILVFLLFLGPFAGLNAQLSPYLDSLVTVVEESKDSEIVLSAYYNLIEGLYWKQDTVNGDRYALDLKAFGTANSTPGIGGMLLVLQSNRIFTIEGNIQNSLRVCFKGIDLLKSANQGQRSIVEVQAGGYNHIGYLFEIAGVYDRSLEYYHLAEKAAEEANLIDLQGGIYNNLAFLLDEYFDDDEGSLQYLKEALALSKKMGDQESVARITSNLGTHYNANRNFNEARTYLEQAIEIQTSLNDSIGLESSWQEMARLSFYENDLETAKSQIQRSLAYQSNETFWRYTTYLNLGDIYLAENKSEKARESYKSGLEIATKYEIIEGEYKALRSLAEVENVTGNWKEAAKYYEKSGQVKDSLDAQWKIANVAKLNTRKELVAIEQEKELLVVENKKLDQENLEQSRKLKIVLGFLALVLIASGIIISKQVQLRRSYSLLVRKSRLLLSQPETTPPVYQPESKESLKEHHSSESLNQAELELVQLIKDELEENESYTDIELTLHSFAQNLGTNTSYLSKVINNTYGKSFRTLINDLRVEKVLKSFEKDEHKAITIHAIAQQAGFKSKSSFNTSFKRYTGVTPTFYIANMDN